MKYHVKCKCSRVFGGPPDDARDGLLPPCLEFQRLTQAPLHHKFATEAGHANPAALAASGSATAATAWRRPASATA